MMVLEDDKIRKEGDGWATLTSEYYSKDAVPMKTAARTGRWTAPDAGLQVCARKFS